MGILSEAKRANTGQEIVDLLTSGLANVTTLRDVKQSLADKKTEIENDQVTYNAGDIADVDSYITTLNENIAFLQD